MGAVLSPRGHMDFKWLGSLWHSQAFDAVWKWHCVVAMLHGILHYARGQGQHNFCRMPIRVPNSHTACPSKVILGV